jgi:hypothetical protein
MTASAMRVVLALCLLCAASSGGGAQEWKVQTDPKTLAARMQKFAVHLKDLGVAGQLKSCRYLVSEYESRDFSAWGAICSLQGGGKPQSILLCDDDGLGHFALKSSGFSFAYEEVDEFTRKNCTGG